MQDTPAPPEIPEVDRTQILVQFNPVLSKLDVLIDAHGNIRYFDSIADIYDFVGPNIPKFGAAKLQNMFAVRLSYADETTLQVVKSISFPFTVASPDNHLLQNLSTQISLNLSKLAMILPPLDYYLTYLVNGIANNDKLETPAEKTGAMKAAMDGLEVRMCNSCGSSCAIPSSNKHIRDELLQRRIEHGVFTCTECACRITLSLVNATRAYNPACGGSVASELIRVINNKNWGDAQDILKRAAGFMSVNFIGDSPALVTTGSLAPAVHTAAAISNSSTRPAPWLN